jgi:hypothetical protein
MNRIYIGQTDLNITIRVNKPITGATTTRINYIAPNQQRGHWNASISDGANGVLSFAAVNDEFNQVGNWTIWPEIVFSNGLRNMGTTNQVSVVNAGTD